MVSMVGRTTEDTRPRRAVCSVRSVELIVMVYGRRDDQFRNQKALVEAWSIKLLMRR